VSVATSIVNRSCDTTDATLLSELLDADGAVVAKAEEHRPLATGEKVVVTQKLPLAKAILWSLERPYLYKVRSTVLIGGKAVDRVTTNFGVRHIRFDADRGFFLNGKPVKLKGTSNHQDHAGVGVALPDRLIVWRIEKLKEMGCNAYRCSHNPVAPELLDACDRLGMLVMDENRHLGDTYAGKAPANTAATDLSALSAMILRDRNHPSVILWSICNEEDIQGTADGGRIALAMKKRINELDGSRPVTAAMNGGHGTAKGFSSVLDVEGFNYFVDQYVPYHKSHPKLPIFASETSSALATRGIYANDKQKGYMSAYDVNAPEWGLCAEKAWRPVADNPFVAGCFVWTGFDYKGEPTPYAWPCINSHFGILDTCGFPKDTFYYYQSWWSDRPVLHIFPHWNWPGKEGQQIDVWCFSTQRPPGVESEVSARHAAGKGDIRKRFTRRCGDA
jgi:beta-galactosidase